MNKNAAVTVLALALASCKISSHTGTVPSPHKISPEVLICKVDISKITGQIPSGLFGSNLEWINNANGISESDGTVGDDWKSLLKESGVRSLRFPGGTFSDYYHWADGTGPIETRPVMPHATDTGSEKNAFGLTEYLTLCADAEIAPFITVNAGTGTAAEAADWVRFANAKTDTPLRVNYWEIGTGLYYPENPGTPPLVFTPGEYSAKLREFSQAMKNADPGIKIAGIAMMNPYAVPLPNGNWTDTVLAENAEDIDYVAVHQAYFPVLFGRENPDIRDAYQALWAAPEAVAESLAALDAKIASRGETQHLKIAVTEWGPLFPLGDSRWADHQKTMGSAVFTARMLQVFIAQPRVELAHFFKFTDSLLGMGTVGFDKKPKLNYLVMRLFAGLAGTQVVGSSIQSPAYTVPDSPLLAPRPPAAEITCVATLGEGGNSLIVTLVNRSWDTAYRVKVAHPGFQAGRLMVREISTPGVLDHNGPDVSPSIPASMYVDPPRTPGFRGLFRIPSVPHAYDSPVLIPPFSVVSLTFNRF